MENEIFEENKNKKKLDQFLTYKKADRGPIFNFTTYIYGNIERDGCTRKWQALIVGGRKIMGGREGWRERGERERERERDIET